MQDHALPGQRDGLHHRLHPRLDQRHQILDGRQRPQYDSVAYEEDGHGFGGWHVAAHAAPELANTLQVPRHLVRGGNPGVRLRQSGGWEGHLYDVLRLCLPPATGLHRDAQRGDPETHREEQTNLWTDAGQSQEDKVCLRCIFQLVLVLFYFVFFDLFS